MTTPVAEAVHASLSHTRLRRDKRPLVLLMFSGGLDGTVLLSTLLEHTDVDVHVHHIALDNADGRIGAEQAATDAVLGYCDRHYRPFVASSSTHASRWELAWAAPTPSWPCSPRPACATPWRAGSTW
jgi:hypothetical protein